MDAGKLGILCGTVTCTLDALSNETPHEVGTVLAPVGAPERMDLAQHTKEE